MVTREYYYELDTRGVLTLDGVIQDDPWFLDFFFRRLAPTANPDYPEYPYVSRCGEEMNYLRVQDTPIVYTGYTDGRLDYAHSLSAAFSPEKLSHSAEGVLYHWAPVGERGRLVPHVAVEIARNIEPWGPYAAYRAPGSATVVPLTPLAEGDDLQILRPKPENHCVGCGQANPYSLRLTFVRNRRDRVVRTWVTPDERMQGSLGTTHGGLVSLLLDESMGKTLSSAGIRAPTARLLVNFRRPMRIGEQYEVRAWIDTQQGRKQFVKGEVRSVDDQTLIAEAEALFLQLRPEADSALTE
jgi:acyl-coenzyme A thioesterase PaaI-like protein